MEKKEFKIKDKIYIADDIGWEYAMQEGEQSGRSDDGRWQNAFLTGKALSGSFSGKRTLGDAGNDYLEGLRYKLGKEAEADWQIEFPDGSKLEFTAVTALTDILGSATDVAPLSGDLTGKGKPTFTPAS
jgi:hypothetical protein